MWKLKPFLVDYPDTKILAMTDPRASYVSGVENWYKYSSLKKNPAHLFFVLNRTIQDASYLKTLDNDFKILRLEDLGNKKNYRKKFCTWLNINYHITMEHSTWNGLRWWGDRLSQEKIPKFETGFF